MINKRENQLSDTNQAEVFTDKDIQLNRRLFERRMLLSPFLYAVEMDDEDRKLMIEWKKEIDEEICELKIKIETNELKKSQKRTLGELPTETDIILFCISRFIMRKQQSEKCFQWKFLKKVFPGGTHNLRELGTEFDTCMDTASLTKALAAEYGINGDIVRPGYLVHYYWQQSEGKRAIIDTFWLKQNTGYLNQPDQYNRLQNPGEKLPLD